MNTYLNWLLMNKRIVAAHIYIAIALMLSGLSAFGIVILAPVIIYGYLAFAVDVEEHGFCLAVFVGPESDEAIIDHIAEELHEETGRPVKVLCYRRTSDVEEADDILEALMGDGNEDNSDEV